MSAISIIMPCYNRSHDLMRVLQAYDNQNTAELFELIAVDDASSDATYQVLTSYRPERYILRALRQERNQGPAAARNLGLSMATSPLVLIVGDDIVPEPGFVHWHLQAHRYFPEKEVAILGRVKWPDDMPCNTLMAHIDGVGAEQFSYHYFQNGHEYDFRHLYTANISLKNGLLATVDKWFDTDFPHAAFEDVELAYRLSKQGLRIVYLSSPVGRHYHYHTIWTFSARQYKVGLMARELFRKHVGVAWFFRLQYLRVLAIWLRALTLPRVRGVADWLEDETLRLASFYEWTPHRFLDDLYTGVLKYFYYKGLTDGFLGKWRFVSRVHDTHARYVLTPLLVWFLQNSGGAETPLPNGSDDWLISKLSEL